VFQSRARAEDKRRLLHVNDTYGMAIKGGLGAMFPKFDILPYQIPSRSLHPAARDLSVELAKAKRPAPRR